MKTRKTIEQFTVYLPRELNRWIRSYAKRERRTLSGSAEIAIRQFKRFVEESSRQS